MKTSSIDVWLHFYKIFCYLIEVGRLFASMISWKSQMRSTLKFKIELIFFDVKHGMFVFVRKIGSSTSYKFCTQIILP